MKLQAYDGDSDPRDGGKLSIKLERRQSRMPLEREAGERATDSKILKITSVLACHLNRHEKLKATLERFLEDTR